MIRYEVEQGSDEWFRLRLGIPTASEFDKIITPAKWELSKSADDYAISKIAELMTGVPAGVHAPTFHMERGKSLEPEAVDLYEFTYGKRVRKAGFITDDNGYYGCSPDAEIPEDNGCMEIKCLDDKNHLGYVIKDELPREFFIQVQGQMFVGGYDYSVFWLYHPVLPPHRIISKKDPVFQEVLADRLEKFRSIMNGYIENLSARDLFKVADLIARPNDSKYLQAGAL